MEKRLIGRAFICVVLLPVLFISCTFHAQIPKDNVVAFSPSSVRIPLTAALYVKSNLRNYTFRRPMLVVAFDDTLSRYVEATTRQMFREVVILDEMGRGTSSQHNDVIVTPVLEKMDFDPGHRVASMTIRWTILNSAGKIIYQNSFTGDGECKDEFTFPRASEQCFSRAIRDQFKKAQEGILSSRWWDISR